MKPARTEGGWFNDDCFEQNESHTASARANDLQNREENNDSEMQGGSPRCLARWLELVLKVLVIYDVFSLLVLFLARLRGADRG